MQQPHRRNQDNERGQRQDAPPPVPGAPGASVLHAGNDQHATCSACTEAERNPQTGRFNAKCQQCSARALAKSFPFFQSKLWGKHMPEYTQALKKVFGPDWEQGHKLVKQEADKLKGASDV